MRPFWIRDLMMPNAMLADMRAQWNRMEIIPVQNAARVGCNLASSAMA